MKRILPVMLALLLLSACVSPAPVDSPTETAPESTSFTEETPTIEAAPGTEEPAPVEETSEEEDTVIADPDTVTLDGLNRYLRLTLPEGWTAIETEDSAADRCILLLDSEAAEMVQLQCDDGFCIEICYWSSFGICGTGVDFREIELKQIGRATLAVEESAESVWWTLILPAQPDQFTLQICAPQAQIDAHRSEIDQILDSLKTGVLAEMHSVEQPRDSF